MSNVQVSQCLAFCNQLNTNYTVHGSCIDSNGPYVYSKLYSFDLFVIGEKSGF